jgi:hypothetical protein
LDDLIDLGVSWLRKPQYDSSCFFNMDMLLILIIIIWFYWGFLSQCVGYDTLW